MLTQTKRIARKLISRPDNSIHFLHIGKNAGTQISNAIDHLNEHNGRKILTAHPHHIYLKDIPKDADYFFSIRKPVSRFRSGFYCRKRKDQPLYNIEWSPGEAATFETFEHANDLGEALFSEGDLGQKAFEAMRCLRHTARNQVDWFWQYGDFFGRRPPVWIVRQENFASDMDRLWSRLGDGIDTSAGWSPPNSASKKHANDYSNIPDMSEKAIANLNAWFAQDNQFYIACERWIESQPHA